MAPDVIECISAYLEEIRTTAVGWSCARQRDENGQIPVSLWIDRMENGRDAFHKLGLPHKIEKLGKDFGIEGERQLRDQTLSINSMCETAWFIDEVSYNQSTLHKEDLQSLGALTRPT